MENKNLTAEAVIAEINNQVEKARQSMERSKRILSLTISNGAYAIKDGTKTEAEVKKQIAFWKKDYKQATQKWLDLSQMEFVVLKNLGVK